MPKKFYRKKATSSKKVPKSVKTYVKKVLDHEAETKQAYYGHGANVNATAIELQASGNTSTFALTRYIAQGLDNDERIGDEIMPVKIESDLTLRVYSDNPTTAVYGTEVRVLLFQYNRSLLGGSGSSTSLTAEDVLFSQGGSIDYVDAPYQFENRENYTILYDKVFEMCASTNNHKNLKIRINKKKLKKTQWLNSGTSNTSLGPGHIWLMVLPRYDSTAGTNNHGLTQLTGVSVVHYKDM